MSLLVMVVLIVVAGWLDARLNWQPAKTRGSAGRKA